MLVVTKEQGQIEKLIDSIQRLQAELGEVHSARAKPATGLFWQVCERAIAGRMRHETEQQTGQCHTIDRVCRDGGVSAAAGGRWGRDQGRRRRCWATAWPPSAWPTTTAASECRVSPLPRCFLGSDAEPIYQVVTRDRNRIAIQSDLLGASALGIKNILCTSGHHQTLTGCSDSANVYDLDAIQVVCGRQADARQGHAPGWDRHRGHSSPC